MPTRPSLLARLRARFSKIADDLCDFWVAGDPAVHELPDPWDDQEGDWLSRGKSARASLDKEIEFREVVKHWVPGREPKSVGSMDFVVCQGSLGIWWQSPEEGKSVLLLTLPLQGPLPASVNPLDKPEPNSPGK